MANSQEREFIKVTLNLYRDDVKFFERWYGHGWSTYVRELLASKVKDMRDERE